MTKIAERVCRETGADPAIFTLLMGDRKTVGGNTLDPFALVNTTLYTRELVKGLEFSASLYNVFDTHYSDPVSSDYLQDSIQQDGRTFRLKLTYHF